MKERVYGTATWQKVRREVLSRDRGVCRICGAKAEAVDHIIPWREGGPWYELENLRAVCTSCNSSRVKRSQRAGASTRRPSREW